MDQSVSIPKGKVFVTGGSGHVGANLVRQLLADGQEVRALELAGADNRALVGLDVERVQGDLRDFAAMRAAVAGCTRVFHVAAKISTLNAGAGEQKEMFGINVMGTRNVMRASLEAGVARAVLTGSFSAVGYDPDDPSKPSTEDMPFWPYDSQVLPYARSKALAEHELLKVVADGLDAVIATSCACIGPHDWLPSRMGRTMMDYAHGRLRAYIDGGFDFVNAADLVQGHLLAMENGRRGHKYIISTHFQTLDDLVAMFCEVTGRDQRPTKLPAAVLAGVTGIYSGALARFFPNLPQRLTPGAIRILRMRRHADTQKAQRELGYRPTNIRDAVQAAFEFFEAEGFVPAGTVASPGWRTSEGDRAAAE